MDEGVTSTARDPGDLNASDAGHEQGKKRGLQGKNILGLVPGKGGPKERRGNVTKKGEDRRSQGRP